MSSQVVFTPLSLAFTSQLHAHLDGEIAAVACRRRHAPRRRRAARALLRHAHRPIECSRADNNIAGPRGKRRRTRRTSTSSSTRTRCRLRMARRSGRPPMLLADSCLKVRTVPWPLRRSAPRCLRTRRHTLECAARRADWRQRRRAHRRRARSSHLAHELGEPEPAELGASLCAGRGGRVPPRRLAKTAAVRLDAHHSPPADPAGAAVGHRPGGTGGRRPRGLGRFGGLGLYAVAGCWAQDARAQRSAAVGTVFARATFGRSTRAHRSRRSSRSPMAASRSPTPRPRSRRSRWPPVRRSAPSSSGRPRWSCSAWNFELIFANIPAAALTAESTRPSSTAAVTAPPAPCRSSRSRSSPAAARPHM